MEIIERGLIDAVVSHERVKPVNNRFSYKVYYTVFPVSRLTLLKGNFLSINRFNIWSIYENDHGPKDGGSWESWIRNILDSNGVGAVCDGEIIHMSLPRVLGYAFNPISFWFCLDSKKDVRAVLCEVNNTFGDFRNYLAAHDDLRPIVENDILKAPKMMHVSPFNTVEGEYHFRFNYSEEKIQVWIEYRTEGSLKVSTYVGGERKNLTDASLLRMFFARPFMTYFVIGRIHYQAFRLWMKGLKSPALPEHVSGETTRALD